MAMQTAGAMLWVSFVPAQMLLRLCRDAKDGFARETFLVWWPHGKVHMIEARTRARTRAR